VTHLYLDLPLPIAFVKDHDDADTISGSERSSRPTAGPGEP
jgi:hypothetical protein